MGMCAEVTLGSIAAAASSLCMLKMLPVECSLDGAHGWPRKGDQDRELERERPRAWAETA